MFYRKDAVLAAVAGILASAGFAFADAAPLALTNTAAAEAAPSGLLMQGLDKLNVAQPLKDNGINVYGWLQVGYTFDGRHHKGVFIAPGPFNHETNGHSMDGRFYDCGCGGDRNHLMLNQFVLRFEKEVNVSPDKWDVGGMIEIMYGTDANAIHANGLGLGFNGWDDRFNPQYSVDFTQAYVDVNVPVGNGLKIRAGKFASFINFETIDPRGNLFYSHSYFFGALPATFTGMVADYRLNDQWAFKFGFTRGWDQCLQDNNGSSIDVVGQVSYKFDNQLSADVNFTFGPENYADSSHYRTTIDTIIRWKATEELSLGFEVLYIYDGGMKGGHAYGDVWGAYAYGSYRINEFVDANARLGFYHDNADFYNWPFNVWDLTVGATIKPFPKDPIGKNLIIRPEIRYSFAEIQFFEVKSGSDDYRYFKDQITFGADLIFTF